MIQRSPVQGNEPKKSQEKKQFLVGSGFFCRGAPGERKKRVNCCQQEVPKRDAAGTKFCGWNPAHWENPNKKTAGNVCVAFPQVPGGEKINQKKAKSENTMGGKLG